MLRRESRRARISSTAFRDANGMRACTGAARTSPVIEQCSEARVIGMPRSCDVMQEAHTPGAAGRDKEFAGYDQVAPLQCLFVHRVAPLLWTFAITTK